MNILRKILDWFRFAGFYLTEIVRSNLTIAHDVLDPADLTRPGILRLDLPDGLSDGRLLLISNLITMTPGSLSLELTPDRRRLILHVLYLDDDIEVTRRHLQENYVHRVLQLG